MTNHHCVLIGRFQPFHMGHLKLVRQALRKYDQLVIVLGSYNSARTLRNPFTSTERELIIRNCLNSDEQERVHFVGVRDYFYQDEFWVSEVISKVTKITRNSSIALLGNNRDFTSYYLDLFPNWQFVPAEDFSEINATEIRAKLFSSSSPDFDNKLPEGTKLWILDHFLKSQAYQALVEEYQVIERYKDAWSKAPYPPIFVTVDAVLVHSGHILLVRRKNHPGKGLLALPGGFLDKTERLSKAVLRELKEETSIDIPDTTLTKSLKSTFVFDHPLRSARGRTITHASYFKLINDSLPTVQASDDAAEAFWIPLLDVAKLESEFYEDHFHIITYFIRNY